MGDLVCTRKVDGMTTQMLPIDMLEPYTKITAPEHYSRVKASMLKTGLRNPLVILMIDEDEWMQDAIEQGDLVRQPSPWGLPMRYRVQCGNHRYWVIKHEMPEITAVECIVCENKEDAYELCKRMRGDKAWKGTI